MTDDEKVLEVGRGFVERESMRTQLVCVRAKLDRVARQASELSSALGRRDAQQAGKLYGLLEASGMLAALEEESRMAGELEALNRFCSHWE